MSEKLIPKSVRLSESMVAFIEAQPGGTFTDKLVRYLNFSQTDFSDRQELLEAYDCSIDEKLRILTQLRDRTRRTQQLLMQLQHLETDIVDLIESYRSMKREFEQPEGTGPP